MNSSRQNSLISIVIPCYNEEEILRNSINSIVEHLSELNHNFEFILVDDGSQDKTVEIIKELGKEYDSQGYSIKGVVLSRNFGHQNAIEAGLNNAKGDAVITMDADLEHPPIVIPKLIEKWENGYDVVYTIRELSKEISFFKRITSKYFYKLYNLLTGWNIEIGSADYRLLDKELVKILTRMEEQNKFYRGLIKWLGFKQIGIKYSQNVASNRRSRYGIIKMLRLALSGIVGFSSRPLYLSIFLGAIVISFSILYAVYVLYLFYSGNTVPGQPSVLITVTFFSGIIMLLLGIQGIYIANIYKEVKSRPSYVVKDKIHFDSDSSNN